jgi:outer membrane protein assembly factor BamB
VKSSPAVAGNVVYFGSFDSHLYAVETETGREMWRFKTGFRVFSSPVAVDGVIYFGSDDGHLYALE